MYFLRQKSLIYSVIRKLSSQSPLILDFDSAQRFTFLVAINKARYDINTSMYGILHLKFT